MLALPCVGVIALLGVMKTSWYGTWSLESWFACLLVCGLARQWLCCFGLCVWGQPRPGGGLC